MEHVKDFLKKQNRAHTGRLTKRAFILDMAKMLHKRGVQSLGTVTEIIYKSLTLCQTLQSVPHCQQSLRLFDNYQI